ncbi:MAG: hypothetical protein QNK04_20845 [Myxococcota bacterium]|nr:hypothetical protein [Myxococcota bacterium]
MRAVPADLPSRAGRALALALLLLAALPGCGRMTPHARTVEEIRVMLQPGDYERLDYVQGEDCVGRYAIFFRLFSPNVVMAARNAIQKAPGANFFANRHVSMDERFIVPLLYHKVCVVVEGRAIKLHTAAEARP